MEKHSQPPNFTNKLCEEHNNSFDSNSNSISICPDNVIIEIEMLHENKTLIGSLTSLNRYAQAFGSKFIDIKLY